MHNSGHGRPPFTRRSLVRPATSLLLFPVLVIAALVGPALATAAPPREIVKVKALTVGMVENPSVGIIPFTDAIYESCSVAPQSSPACQEVGGVDYRYRISQLEVTVGQYVDFLNTVDPKGTDKHNLYTPSESSDAWPRFGQINESGDAGDGRHYSVAYPEWADKPYGFANFLRSARFVNSLYNGKLIGKRTSGGDGFKYTHYKVRLSRSSNRGMYDLRRNKRAGATRAAKKGFVVPSQDEWIKSAYFDPDGGGTLSYWKYPTNAGVFGDDTATAPNQVTLDPATGDVTNSGSQPLANFHASGEAAPSWCPPAVQPQSNCTSVNPFGIDPTTYDKLYQGSLGTVGQAKTTSPWGTLDQGGNAVEWTDTITPRPSGKSPGRVWRRLHGGISNAPAYQLWLSAVGLQPQNNKVYNTTYPWLGFRVGVVGNLSVARRHHRGSRAERAA
jgi:hypothetical protein